ncbi:MAG: hypothetical protein V4590_14815 [Bacteroidota bacterium]
MINELDEIKALFDEFYLIDEPLTNVVKENENPIKINFEGGNKTGLVFVFEESLSPADKEMIHNLIHKAMKLTMEDVALVDLSQHNDVSAGQMINIIKPARMIVWGAHDWLLSEVSALKKYEVGTYHNSSILAVDAVTAFQDNVPLKTTLWTNIQLLLKA